MFWTRVSGFSSSGQENRSHGTGWSKGRGQSGDQCTILHGKGIATLHCEINDTACANCFTFTVLLTVLMKVNQSGRFKLDMDECQVFVVTVKPVLSNQSNEPLMQLAS